MAEPFVGQIIQSGFNFPPRGYASCDGQLMSIAQNTALFSLLGVTFGGDGRVTFGLPDLRGRTPVHQGQGPGLPPCVIGELAGVENVSVLISEIPMHNHLANASGAPGPDSSPIGDYWATDGQGQATTYSATMNGQMNPLALATAGGSQPHNNMQPYLVSNFCIALVGIFPSRG